MNRALCLFLLMLPLHVSAFEREDRSIVFKPATEKSAMTGNIAIDLFGQKGLATLPQPQEEGVSVQTGRKSPWLAAGLSALVPGAGEFYAENYWKAAIFLAVDVAAWALVYSFNKKGDNQTEFFQKYADEHWSVLRYAENAVRLLQSIDSSRASYYSNAGLIARNAGASPWQQVNWNLLNQMEREIGSNRNGTYYSHSLPLRPEQQYYELIGKYHQFNQGWDDAAPSFVYGDPVTERFKYYSTERGKANDYYADATTFVTVAVVNHVLSAFDAAWTASSFNKNIHASMRIQTIPTGLGYARVPVAHVEILF